MMYFLAEIQGGVNEGNSSDKISGRNSPTKDERKRSALPYPTPPEPLFPPPAAAAPPARPPPPPMQFYERKAREWQALMMRSRQSFNQREENKLREDLYIDNLLNGLWCAYF